MKVSFWLIPESSELQRLTTLVDSLAERYDAPRFTPHITLYMGDVVASESPQDIVAPLVAGLGEVVFCARALEFSERYTKSCYIQFEPHPECAALSEKIRINMQSRSAYAFDPHLSLMYLTLDQAQRAEIRKDLLLPKEVRCSHLAAIITAHPTARRADVEGWREAFRISLK